MDGDAAAHNSSGPPSTGDFVIRHWRSAAPIAADRSPNPHRPPRPADPGRPVSNGGGDFDPSPHRSRGVDRGPVGYVSLRDLLDSPPQQPLSPQQDEWACFSATHGSCGGGPGEIRIRNRLVKQAAYAYLQPTPSAAESDRSRRRRALRRTLAVLTCGLAADPLLGCIDFIRHLLRWPRRRRLF